MMSIPELSHSAAPDEASYHAPASPLIATCCLAFPAEFYEEMFRLRALQYPPKNPNFRPQYFGLLTNDIVYERLAPGLLAELKLHARKDEKKAHLHRRLTQEAGRPKLREHLASVVTAMKLSTDYYDFISKLNRIHPRFGDNLSLDLEDIDRG